MRNIDEGRARQAERVKRVVKDAQAVNAGGQKREAPLPSAEAIEERRQRLAGINTLLTAPAEFRVKYAEFLNTKNTGLVRVYPDQGCGKGIVVDVKELERCGETAGISGGGSRFSFRLNKLPNKLRADMILYHIENSDIHFTDGKLVVGAQAIQDLIADIGEVDLASVNLKSDSVQFLRDFKPTDTSTKGALQDQELAKGVKEKGFLYSNSVPVHLNRTYVMRSIAFSTYSFYHYWTTDVITAFKIVANQPDGSIVILWKELKESPAPKRSDR